MATATPQAVTLIGASVRAAAFSALRAGLTPWCIDLFADSDLQAVAETRRISSADYPGGLLEILHEAPEGPIVYTGALENYPQLIGRLPKTLWGNDSRSLRRARDPFYLSPLLAENGLLCPAITLACGSPLNVLRKPFRGAGGAQIAWASMTDPVSPDLYHQQFVPGLACSAVFCAFVDCTTLLGVSEQIVGEPWLNAKPFHYAGSIGPLEISASLEQELLHLGEVLQTGCGLRGLFGVDFILQEDRPWLVEVNPRYTASIEVLEYAMGFEALTHHRAAFDDSARACVIAPHLKYTVGKAILFAPKQFKFPETGPWVVAFDPLICPDFADIPVVGEVIEEGWPILTMFARGETAAECRQRLRERATEVLSQLAEKCGEAATC